MLISEFDPWKGKLCTCPKKYSFSPYTGCSHACIYCYITSYIPNAFHARLKKDLIKRLKKELHKVDTYISMSNSSDPYTPEEKKFQMTRKCLKLFKEYGIKVLIITKSDMIVRDIDLIKNMKATVSITITTLDKEKAKKIERFAPPPSKRINALKTLHEHGILNSVRIDPIIPGINDEEIEEIIYAVSPYVKHIISSTLKPRQDSFKRLKEVMDIDKYKWIKYGNSFYLPKNVRFSFLERIEKVCKKNNLTFSACREGYPFKAGSCDGSHLINLM
ncbi:MAG TPA: radical SAM protein [Thermoplasmata archaeon]|nr:radical SAM protein [Thermoplasmata archaeon]